MGPYYMSRDVYIVSAVRTPVGKIKGIFHHVRPDDLLAHAMKGALAHVPQLDKNMINDVIVGCAMPEAEQGMNVARIALLLAGLPNTVPGMTINRFCSSGLQSIALAADRIRCGDADVMIAGGTESMSMVPMGGNKYSINPEVFTDENVAIAYGMGITAEKVAKQWNITREAQDNFALESHRRALEANEKNYFSQEIIPVEVQAVLPDLVNGQIQKHKKIIDKDEGPRAGSTVEMLAKLPTVFAAKGTVTAANSSQMSDGAAALILVSERALKQFHLTPIAKFLSYSVVGVPPDIMGIGPRDAIPQALKKANLTLTDIEWIELNEAFAAQTLAVIKDLALDPAKVNPWGGAIALGHPLGATGAIRAATLIHGLRRSKKRYGIVTMCIGTGMGAAGVFEAIA
jgi:acetyl-CoA acyltransferase